MKRFYFLLLVAVSTMLFSCSETVDFTREMAITKAIAYSPTYPYASILVSKVPVQEQTIMYIESGGTIAETTTPKQSCWLAIVDTDQRVNGPRDIILLYYDQQSGKEKKHNYFGFMPTVSVEMESVYTPK